MKTLKTEVALRSATRQRTSIGLNGKLHVSPFVVANPVTSTDLDILTTMAPKSGVNLDCLGGVVYRIFEHDTIVGKKIKFVDQYDLKKRIVVSNFVHLNESRIKFIDPAMELLRKRYKSYIRRYKMLKGIPDYLLRYLTEFEMADRKSTDFDALHIRFWRRLFQKIADERGTGRSKIAHFVKWQDERQRGMGSDIFLPPTPFIGVSGCEYLVEKAIEINRDASDLVDRDVATFFNMDSQVFRKREILMRVLDYVDQKPGKCVFNIFKIWNIDDIVKPGFGESARRNFELFLRVIKSMKDESKGESKVFGLLNGGTGGFGYCLTGAVFDFFVYTIGGHQYYIPHAKKVTHRKCLNPNTLVLEGFDGLKELYESYNSMPLPYLPRKKPTSPKTFSKKAIDGKRWSVESRLHDVIMWNELTREVINSMSNDDDSLFFNRVQNSDYAILAPIIRRVLSS